jgi:hypothetical protein
MTVLDGDPRPRCEFLCISARRTLERLLPSHCGEARRDWLSPPDRFGPPYVRLKRSACLSFSKVQSAVRPYFAFACAFRLSAQYRFIRADTALRAAADIVRVRVVASLIDRRTARRRWGRRSAGNARLIAMISARRRL